MLGQDSPDPPLRLEKLIILLMDKILHHLGWLKPYKLWDNHHPWWCRILSINSSSFNPSLLRFWILGHLPGTSLAWYGTFKAATTSFTVMSSECTWAWAWRLQIRLLSLKLPTGWQLLERG